jgi:hypothetical protein
VSGHKFKIGQTVRYRTPFGHVAAADYKVTQLSPAEDDELHTGSKAPTRKHSRGTVDGVHPVTSAFRVRVKRRKRGARSDITKPSRRRALAHPGTMSSHNVIVNVALP